MKTELEICAGEIAARAAERYWQLAPEKIRRHIMPEMPRYGAREYFTDAVRAAEIAFFAMREDTPQGLCWVASGGGALGCPHISFLLRPDAEILDLARNVMRQLSRRYSCLMALIPNRYAWAIQFAGAMGMQYVAMLNNALRIRWKNCLRPVNGILMVHNFNHGGAYA